MQRILAPQPFLLAALVVVVGLLVCGEAASASQSKGEVRRLQRALEVPADGVFGPQTQRAVRRLQRRHGMTADGIAGPVTRRVLGLGPGPVLRRERRGAPSPARRGEPRSSRAGGGVRALQRALGIRADGAFGPQTERAVRRFQRRQGLAADGVVGPDTRRALGLGPGDTLNRPTLERLIQAANRIAEAPYRWGGGHRTFDDDTGYDCSGSVSYVLHEIGLLTYALTAGAFVSYGEPGPGRRVTIYARRSHVFMVVDGRRYDTTAIRKTGSRWTWTPRPTEDFVARHPPGL